MITKTLLLSLALSLSAQALADGAPAPIAPPNTIAAAEHAAMVYKAEIRNISALTDKMRKLFDEIPSNDPNYVAYRQSSSMAKTTMDRQAMMQEIVDTRSQIESSLKKVENLSEGMARLENKYPGIENAVGSMQKTTVKNMIEAHNLNNPEATMRYWESPGASRLALDDEDAHLLQKPLELKFRNGSKITLKPGSHVKVRFTEGDYEFEGPVVQSQPGWHDEFIMLTKDPHFEGNSYYGVPKNSIKSIEVQNADGTVTLFETGQPTNAQLRSETIGLKKLGDFLTRTRAETGGGGGGVIEATPLPMSDGHASF